MLIVNNYFIAVLLCVLAMICWGSWQNTRNLARKEWRFELFYWDYSLGILLFSLVAAFTFGSLGQEGRTFLQDLQQADGKNIFSAMLGGAVWNIGTLLLTAGIAVAGMSVAFPIGGGIGWILGIAINYFARPAGNPVFLFGGSLIIIGAIVLSMMAYRRLAKKQEKPSFKGIFLSLMAGIAIAFFYKFVAQSLDTEITREATGKLTPYTAVFFFSLGAFISTFIYNPFFMKFPVEGDPVSFRTYLTGTLRDHVMGLLGGAIWCLGMTSSFMAVKAASPAISYGLSNAAPVVAVLWGLIVWKEFHGAPSGTNRLLAGMFVLYLIGLVLITLSNV